MGEVNIYQVERLSTYGFPSMEEMISQEAIAQNNLERKIVCNNEFERFNHKLYPKILDTKLVLLFACAIVMIFFISASCYPFQLNSVRAETGSGTDIFKVIVTIMGADKNSTGDVVALVTVNDHSRVKLFNLGGNSSSNGLLYGVDAGNSSYDSDNQNRIIEYVATFPNVTVNVGDEYKTCALPMKTLKLMCVEGANSPGKRPEIVDLSLNSTITQSTESFVGRPNFVPNLHEDDRSSIPKNDKDTKDDEADK